jgi:hypothetical protein
VIYEARLERGAGVDASTRKHLEGLQARLERQLREGDTRVRDKLERITEQLSGPAVPPALEYLKQWSDQLHGRSGEGLNGLLPLSPTVVRDWAFLQQIYVLPHEFDALLMLDTVRRNPPAEKKDDG